MTTPALLTTAEVAALFRVHESTVIAWAKAGTIPAFRLQGTRGWRFRRSDVDRLLDQHANTEPAA